jgi:purine-binding chemotaxis protein CheW
MNNAASFPIVEAETADYVAARIGGQLFGVPITQVRDVFVPRRMTRVPLAARDVAGVLNLRGRIVTVVDMHARLGFAGQREGAGMAIGVDQRGESYGLLVDAVGEVLRLGVSLLEAVPVNLDTQIARVASGVYQLDSELMVVLDIERVLDLEGEALAA